jgi:hypothetical protein
MKANDDILAVVRNPKSTCAHNDPTWHSYTDRTGWIPYTIKTVYPGMPGGRQPDAICVNLIPQRRSWL